MPSLQEEENREQVDDHITPDGMGVISEQDSAEENSIKKVEKRPVTNVPRAPSQKSDNAVDRTQKSDNAVDKTHITDRSRASVVAGG